MAADKAFKQSDLDDAAIKLEAQIKSDAGTVTKPAATLRRDADAAFQKNDFRAGMLVLGQLVTRRARRRRELAAACAHRPADQAARRPRKSLAARSRLDRRLYRLSTRERPRRSRPTACPCSANRSPIASNGAPRSIHCACRSNCVKPPICAGNMKSCGPNTVSACSTIPIDSDSISPRACFQFSEELPGRRTDFSPFVAVAGMDRPAISANEKQLCVEGLKHGERYSVTLRAGLPSVVKETLAKSADFTIFVRDRKPFVRFSGKAYVLPRTGQRGIPVLSVNTKAVGLSIYRIGDRNLVDTLLGYDFQRNLSRYQAEQLANERGAKIWSGELAVESKLNTEVTTAFPLDQAVKDLGPGVYAMTAEAKDVVSNEYGQQATQWFIVSDLGLDRL